MLADKTDSLHLHEILPMTLDDSGADGTYSE